MNILDKDFLLNKFPKDDKDYSLDTSTGDIYVSIDNNYYSPTDLTRKVENVDITNLITKKEINKLDNTNVAKLMQTFIVNYATQFQAKNTDFAKNNTISAKNNEKLAKNNVFSANFNDNFAKNYDIFPENYQIDPEDEPKTILKKTKNGKITGFKWDKKFHLYNTLIRKYSNHYANDTKDLIKNIEHNLNKVLKNKKSQTNQAEVRKFYYTCISLANKGNDEQLYYKLEDTITWLSNQNKGHVTKNKIEIKKQNKRIRNNILLIVAAATIIFTTGFLFIKKRQNKTSSYSTEQLFAGVFTKIKKEKQIYSVSEIYAITDNYYKNIELTEWRYETIVDAFPKHKINKKQAYAIVDSINIVFPLKKNK